MIYFLFLEDSPRNLMINNYPDEAFKILEKVGKVKLTGDDKLRLLKEIKYGENNIVDNHVFASLFNQKNITTTFILTLIFIVALFIIYCPFIIMSSTLKSIGVEQKVNTKNESESIIGQIIVVNLIASVGFILAGVLSEFEFLGRKFAMGLGFFGYSILTLFSYIFIEYFEFFLGVEQIFGYIFAEIMSSYAYEYYDTRTRDVALGYLYCCGRFSSFFSQFIGIELAKINPLFPFYLITILGFIGGILSISLPYETYGHFLDIHMEKEKIIKENIEFSKLSDNSRLNSNSNDSKDIENKNIKGIKDN